MAERPAAKRCKECGELMMPTPSGSVCPAGHGRLHRRMDATQKRVWREALEAKPLPQARVIPGFANYFTVEGTEGYWVRVPRSHLMGRSGTELEWMRANAGDEPVYLKRHSSKRVENALERERVKRESGRRRKVRKRVPRGAQSTSS